ncbi:MAG: hypothetical protein DSY80_02580 [Desulfocapsa sp.]|nr:MAG: hypothetical protein DSY80_02580 [Desulfocapsa sp.]
MRVTGAEVWADFINSRLISKGMRLMDVDAPSLLTEEECLERAKEFSFIAEGYANSGVFVGAMDPAVQPEDEITINGVDYIVDKVSFEINPADKPGAWMTIYARKKITDEDRMIWGSSKWGEAKWQ